MRARLSRRRVDSLDTMDMDTMLLLLLSLSNSGPDGCAAAFILGTSHSRPFAQVSPIQAAHHFSTTPPGCSSKLCMLMIVSRTQHTTYRAKNGGPVGTIILQYLSSFHKTYNWIEGVFA